MVTVINQATDTIKVATVIKVLSRLAVAMDDPVTEDRSVDSTAGDRVARIKDTLTKLKQLASKCTTLHAIQMKIQMLTLPQCQLVQMKILNQTNQRLCHLLNQVLLS